MLFTGRPPSVAGVVTLLLFCEHCVVVSTMQISALIFIQQSYVRGRRICVAGAGVVLIAADAEVRKHNVYSCHVLIKVCTIYLYIMYRFHSPAIKEVSYSVIILLYFERT